MSRALLSIRTDEETKKEITEFADSVGLTTSAFVTVVLKQAIKSGKVVLLPDQEPTPYLKNIIKKADRDLAAGHASQSLNKQEAKEHLRSLMKR